MSLRRIVLIASIGATLAFIAGCGGVESPTTRAWERAYSPQVVQPTAAHQDGPLSASDGLGRAVFRPANTPVGGVQSNTFAHVPE